MRQPVQQALLILRSQGLLRDAPGRGLMVAPLDAEHVRNVYEIRGMIDGLASAKAAERGRDAARREGPAFIEHGRAAVASGSIPRMIAADMDFHFFLYGLSGNPSRRSAPCTGAICAACLDRRGSPVRPEPPKAIWDQHEAILDAVIAGDADAAERLARHHIANAGEALTPRVETTDADVAPPSVPLAPARGRRAAPSAAPSDATAAARPSATSAASTRSAATPHARRPATKPTASGRAPSAARRPNGTARRFHARIAHRPATRFRPAKVTRFLMERGAPPARPPSPEPRRLTTMDATHFGNACRVAIRAAASNPDRPAYAVPPMPGRSLHHPDGFEVTWAQTLAAVEAKKAIYARAGFGRGHRVAILFNQRPEFFFHYYALNALGTSVVPVNPDYRSATRSTTSSNTPRRISSSASTTARTISAPWPRRSVALPVRVVRPLPGRRALARHAGAAGRARRADRGRAALHIRHDRPAEGLHPDERVFPDVGERYLDLGGPASGCAPARNASTTRCRCITRTACRSRRPRC